MYRYFYFFFFIALVSCQVSSSPPSTHPILSKIISADDLKEDLAVLRRKLEEYHPGLYRYNTPQAIHQLFDTTFAHIRQSMSLLDFYQLISKTVATIQCGHTQVRLPNTYYQTHYLQEVLFPIRFKWLNQKAIIQLNVSRDTTIHKGMELVSINGVKLAQILSKLLPYISVDAHIEGAKYRFIEKRFAELYYLFCEQNSPYFLIEVKNNHTQEVFIKKVLPVSLENWDYFTAESDALLDIDFLDDLSVAVFTLKSFDNDRLKRHQLDFKLFVNQAFGQIHQQKTQHLILDIRGNKGGNQSNAIYLLSYLKEKLQAYFSKIEVTKHYSGYGKFSKFKSKGKYYINPQLFDTPSPETKVFKGKVYVLMDGDTFSAATDFAVLLQAENEKVVLIGEETGGAFQGNNSGIISAILMRNSGVMVSLPLWSSYNAATPHSSLQRGLLPHYPIQNTWRDIEEEIDTQKKFIFDLIKKDVSFVR